MDRGLIEIELGIGKPCAPLRDCGVLAADI
jgi:hypothetical protein